MTDRFLIVGSTISTFLVEVSAMQEDELEEQRRRGVCDAQLLVALDRLRARMLLLEYYAASPTCCPTPPRSKTSQDVYDEAFFGELEERLRCCC